MLAARPDETRDEAWLQEVEELGRPLTNLSAHWRHNAINLGSLALLLAAFPASYLLLRPLPAPLGVVLLGLVYGTFIFSHAAESDPASRTLSKSITRHSDTATLPDFSSHTLDRTSMSPDVVARKSLSAITITSRFSLCER